MGLVKEMMREIGNKSREFYEFVLPPVDMYLSDDTLKVVIDLPGFAKDEIDLTLRRNVLSIRAQKRPDDTEGRNVVRQRPDIIDKRIRLPVHVRDGEERIDSARYDQGVVTLVIPVAKRGKSIQLD